MPVTTATVGNSSDIFPGILDLYVVKGARIIDTTYASGVFWQKVNTAQYQLTTSDIDINTHTDTHADCRHLPYPAEVFQCVVLDPPFMAGVNVRGRLNEQYRVNELNQRYKGVIALYRDAITEAQRILCDHGILIVKCQDIVESGRRRFADIVIADIALSRGFELVDLLTLVNPRTPMMRHQTQQHARSNNSFFWVFRKA